MEIIAESRYRLVIPRHGRMRVPGVVFATRALIPDPAADRALEQVVNVAELRGIVVASYAMPDLHWGYGFPIGGVAATDIARGGVVSPGGVGFDIACGVRLLAADLSRDELLPVRDRVMDRLADVIPCGAGRGGLWHLRGRAELEKLQTGGAGYAVACGHGGQQDLNRCEDHGVAEDAGLAQVSSRALDRGLHQVVSLGSGNHFLEVQAVDRVFDPAAAEAFGLAEGRVCVMIHCGSRGLGHQICTNHVQIMDQVMPRYGITVPDRQLACAPVTSPPAPGRPAGPDPRLDGDVVLCPGRGRRRRGVRLGLPRRGQADEPPSGRRLHHRPGTAAAAGTPGHRRTRRLGPRPRRGDPAGLQGHHPGGRGRRRRRAMPEGGPARPARRHRGLTGTWRLHVYRDRACPPALHTFHAGLRSHRGPARRARSWRYRRWRITRAPGPLVPAVAAPTSIPLWLACTPGV